MSKSSVGLMIPEPSNPDGFPVIRVPDSLVTPGTLIYTDPTLPGNEWAPGVPGTVPNLASWAPDLTASMTAQSLSVSSSIASGLVERTAKGGLHVAHKRGAGAGNESLSLQNAAIRAYLAAHADHDYYLAASLAVTRAPAASYIPAVSHRLFGLISTANVDQMAVRVTNDRTAITALPATLRTLITPAAIVNGAGLVEAAFDGYAGAANASASLAIHHNGGAGSPHLSWVQYLLFLEDLTVSGRTPQQAQAAFTARHNQVRGVGGRYAGDTWTDPATL